MPNRIDCHRQCYLYTHPRSNLISRSSPVAQRNVAIFLLCFAIDNSQQSINKVNLHRFAHSIFFYSHYRLTEIGEGKTFFRTSATLHTRFAQQIDRKNCYFCLILCVLTPHRLYAFILYIKCIVLLLQLDFALDCFCCFFFVHFAASQCSSFFLFRSVSDSLIWLSAFIILKMDAI